MGALGSPNIGDPFKTNVSIVIFVGSIWSISGVGSINNSCLSHESFIPNITTTIVIDAIMAPIASEGACNNKSFIFKVHLVFCSISK